MRNKTALVFGIIAAIFLVTSIHFYYRYQATSDLVKNSNVYVMQLEKLTGVGRLSTVHMHADYKIYINGKYINLTLPELQAPEAGTLDYWANTNLSRFTHQHPGEPDLIHIHAPGITLGMFFRGIGGNLTSSCVKLPDIVDKRTYCSDADKTLKVFVNKARISDPQDYVMKDLDKILISYGNEGNAEILDQLGSIGNIACIQSGKC